MMNNRARAREGYILTLTVLILALCIMLVTQLFEQGTTYIRYTQIATHREQAKQCAFSGVQLAISQLTVLPDETEKRTPQDKAQPQPDIQLLHRLLPVINRWQQLELKEEVDGVEGSIKWCISSENGKLDLNHIFDGTTKKFLNEGKRGDTKKVVKLIFDRIKSEAGNKDLFGAFEKFLKERQVKIDDVSELLALKEFKPFERLLFYVPPEKGAEQRPVYLADIFTTFSGRATLDPWLLSDSWCAILGLKRAAADDSEKRMAVIKKYEKNIGTPTSWTQQAWSQQLAPLYNKEFKTIPAEIVPLLRGRFEPKTFSVLSYGTVGGVTQKVYAIVEKKKGAGADEPLFDVKNVYWL